MAQTFITPTIVAKEALIALENNLVFANLVHRDYADEFKKVGDTVLIRKPATFTAEAWAGTTITKQTVVESSVPVSLDTVFDVSFAITAKELALSVVDFSEQIVAPAMRAIAQGVDAKLAGLFVDVAAHYPVSTTAVAADLAGVRAQLNIDKVPFEDRSCVLHPITEKDFIVIDAFLHAEKRGDTKAIKEASMGRVMGMDFFMSQNIATHTSLVLDTAGNAPACTAGATAMTMIGLTNGEVVAAGDVFKVVGSSKGYLIKTGGTVATTACAVTFTPALDAVIADAAVVTFMKTHKANLAFHKNAFALVTRPLANPIGGAQAAQENYKGLSCRVVYDYDMDKKSNICSIDLLCGVKTLDKDLAARLVDYR